MSDASAELESTYDIELTSVLGTAVSYDSLTDKPSINGHVLTGSMTLAELLSGATWDDFA